MNIQGDFYPRPPCGGRPVCGAGGTGEPYFYPRPPCGGRPLVTKTGPAASLFLSTPSVWRATTGDTAGLRGREISIHALRVEGDCGKASEHAGRMDFYPRPPCGGRQQAYKEYAVADIFLSTPSVWRATGLKYKTEIPFSDFYPRPPCGGRRYQSPGIFKRRAISIHALRVEGDRYCGLYRLPVMIFLSTPSVWRATKFPRRISGFKHDFYPRPPCGGRPANIASTMFLS